MPHIIVEHSFLLSKSTVNDFLLSVNKEIIKNEGNFDIRECKSRAIFCQNFVIADNSIKKDFMHITIKIIKGRELLIRQKLAQNIIDLAATFVKETTLPNQVALSLNIEEIDREIYQKTIIYNQ